MYAGTASRFSEPSSRSGFCAMRKCGLNSDPRAISRFPQGSNLIEIAMENGDSLNLGNIA